jgi:hypothetical protein
MPDPTTDPVIPPEAVEAVARQVFFAKHGLDWDFVWFAEEKRAKARQDASEFALAGLLAALPHLRPLVEAQELRLATEVALKLGRQEMLAEIAAEISEPDAWQLDNPHMSWVVVQLDKDTYRQLRAARDTGKGNS